MLSYKLVNAKNLIIDEKEKKESIELLNKIPFYDGVHKFLKGDYATSFKIFLDCSYNGNIFAPFFVNYILNEKKDSLTKVSFSDDQMEFLQNFQKFFELFPKNKLNLAWFETAMFIKDNESRKLSNQKIKTLIELSNKCGLAYKHLTDLCKAKKIKVKKFNLSSGKELEILDVYRVITEIVNVKKVSSVSVIYNFYNLIKKYSAMLNTSESSIERIVMKLAQKNDEIIDLDNLGLKFQLSGALMGNKELNKMFMLSENQKCKSFSPFSQKEYIKKMQASFFNNLTFIQAFETLEYTLELDKFMISEDKDIDLAREMMCIKLFKLKKPEEVISEINKLDISDQYLFLGLIYNAFKENENVSEKVKSISQKAFFDLINNNFGIGEKIGRYYFLGNFYEFGIKDYLNKNMDKAIEHYYESAKELYLPAIKKYLDFMIKKWDDLNASQKRELIFECDFARRYVDSFGEYENPKISACLYMIFCVNGDKYFDEYFPKLIKLNEKYNGELIDEVMNVFAHNRAKCEKNEITFEYIEKVVKKLIKEDELNKEKHLNILGQFYEFWGEYEKSLYYLEEANKVGDSYLIKRANSLGLIYLYGTDNIEKNLNLAEEYFFKSKTIQALYNLSLVYNRKSEYKKAFNCLFRLSKESTILNNDNDVLHDLALCYYEGRGTDVDIKKAREIFELLHERDFAKGSLAMFSLTLNEIMNLDINGIELIEKANGYLEKSKYCGDKRTLAPYCAFKIIFMNEGMDEILKYINSFVSIKGSDADTILYVEKLKEILNKAEAFPELISGLFYYQNLDELVDSVKKEELKDAVKAEEIIIEQNKERINRQIEKEEVVSKKEKLLQEMQEFSNPANKKFATFKAFKRLGKRINLISDEKRFFVKQGKNGMNFSLLGKYDYVNVKGSMHLEEHRNLGKSYDPNRQNYLQDVMKKMTLSLLDEESKVNVDGDKKTMLFDFKGKNKKKTKSEEKGNDLYLKK